jgi:hypothetical protein
MKASFHFAFQPNRNESVLTSNDFFKRGKRIGLDVVVVVDGVDSFLVALLFNKMVAYLVS